MPLIRISEDKERVEKPKYDVLAEGAYEVYVEEYTDPEIMDDFEKSTIVFKIRDDIEQDGANRKIWDNINTNPNIAWKLSNIAKAAGVPVGTDFENLDDYLRAIEGASMKVYVKHREYNGKVYANVSGYYPTSHEPYEVFKDIDEDELVI